MAPRIPTRFMAAIIAVIIGTAFIIEVAGVIPPPPVRRRRQPRAVGRCIRQPRHRHHDRDPLVSLVLIRGLLRVGLYGRRLGHVLGSNDQRLSEFCP